MADATSFTTNKLRAIGRTHYVGVVEQTSGRVFLGVSVLLFVVSTVVTVLWCNAMSGIGGMPMRGGWTMSMAWMRMPRQTWVGAAASFVGMWGVMMMAMMLPSITPILWGYRCSLAAIEPRYRGRLTTLVGLGYFFVWTLFGLAAFAGGAVIAGIEMARPELARAVPAVRGMIVLIAGAVQFTERKAHYLNLCREVHRAKGTRPVHAREAWRFGVHFGMHCGISCANLTAILLVLGVMDLRVMAAVTAAITAERLGPAGMRLPEAIGAVSIGMGLIMIARAASPA